MNYSAAIFIANDQVRGVKVSYDQNLDGSVKGDLYTFKTFDKSLAPGDFVVVPTGTRHKMTVVRVEETNVDVDPNIGVELKWIIAKVDRSTYEQTIEMEKAMIEKIKAAKLRRERQKLAEELLADNPELRDLGTLRLTSSEVVNEDIIEEAPPKP